MPRLLRQRPVGPVAVVVAAAEAAAEAAAAADEEAAQPRDRRDETRESQSENPGSPPANESESENAQPSREKKLAVLHRRQTEAVHKMFDIDAISPRVQQFAVKVSEALAGRQRIADELP